MGKRCTKCSELKDESQFQKYSRAKDGLRYVCKKCRSDEYRLRSDKVKQYQAENKESIDEVRKRRRIKYITLNNEWLKNNKPLVCAKCGYDNSACAIEGHHVKPEQKKRKEDSFGWWVQLPPRKFIKKITSVDIVFLCANCHKELHFGIWNINELGGEYALRKIG